ncbi:MAG TPA: hypothetical protein VIS72_10430 [Anaerolineales bacterium]
MQQTHTMFPGLSVWKRGHFLTFLLAVSLLMSLTAPKAAAMQASSSFEATFAGTFQITEDVGNSPVFVVQEAGSGDEQTFGDFTYTTYLLQNLARIPPGCGRSSSTGVGGSAELSFADGVINLRRISGTVCFAFPNINVEESWVIASGTGNYAGATGTLSRQLVGNVISGVSSGMISGTINLVD